MDFHCATVILPSQSEKLLHRREISAKAVASYTVNRNRVFPASA